MITISGIPLKTILDKIVEGLEDLYTEPGSMFGNKEDMEFLNNIRNGIKVEERHGQAKDRIAFVASNLGIRGRDWFELKTFLFRT